MKATVVEMGRGRKIIKEDERIIRKEYAQHNSIKAKIVMKSIWRLNLPDLKNPEGFFDRYLISTSSFSTFHPYNSTFVFSLATGV